MLACRVGGGKLSELAEAIAGEAALAEAADTGQAHSRVRSRAVAQKLQQLRVCQRPVRGDHPHSRVSCRCC